MFNSSVSTGKWHIVQVKQSFKFGIICQEYFTTPDCSVCSVTCTVISDTDNRFIQMMFCHYCGNMSVMVLDFLQWKTCTFCKPGSHIIRMQITDDQFRFKLEPFLILFQCIRVKVQRLLAVGISNVRRKKKRIIFAECESNFQFCSSTERLNGFKRKFYGRRNISAGSSYHHILRFGSAYHRIITAVQDGTIMGQEEITKTAQFLFFSSNGFVLIVTGRHY